MIRDMHFNNMGYLDVVIPTELFNSLKKECDVALTKNSEMKSGLSGSGVPIHKYVEDENNLKSLEDYTFKLADIYKDKFEMDPSQTIILVDFLNQSSNCFTTRKSLRHRNHLRKDKRKLNGRTTAIPRGGPSLRPVQLSNKQ